MNTTKRKLNNNLERPLCAAVYCVYPSNRQQSFGLEGLVELNQRHTVSIFRAFLSCIAGDVRQAKRQGCKDRPTASTRHQQSCTVVWNLWSSCYCNNVRENKSDLPYALSDRYYHKVQLQHTGDVTRMLASEALGRTILDTGQNQSGNTVPIVVGTTQSELVTHFYCFKVAGA